MIRYLFRELSVLILFMFLSIPEAQGNQIFTTYSLRVRAEPHEGMLDLEVIQYFHETMNNLRAEFLEMVSNYPDRQEQLEIARRSEFFGVGDQRTPEWQQWWQTLVKQGITGPLDTD